MQALSPEPISQPVIDYGIIQNTNVGAITAPISVSMPEIDKSDFLLEKIINITVE